MTGLAGAAVLGAACGTVLVAGSDEGEAEFGVVAVACAERADVEVSALTSATGDV